MQKRYNLRGFTLIELMIVVAIIAILAAIALPSYTESVRKGKRADAQSALVGLASAMERRFTEMNNYCGAGTGNDGDCPGGSTDLGAPTIFSAQVPIDGGTAYYDLSIESIGASTTTYEIRAVRTGSMAGDKCGDFTLNQIGVQGLVNNTDSVANCWRQ